MNSTKQPLTEYTAAPVVLPCPPTSSDRVPIIEASEPERLRKALDRLVDALGETRRVAEAVRRLIDALNTFPCALHGDAFGPDRKARNRCLEDEPCTTLSGVLNDRSHEISHTQEDQTMKLAEKLSFTRGVAAGLSHTIARTGRPLTWRAFAVATLVLGLLAGCDAAGPEPLEQELEAEEALSDEEPFVPGGALERTSPGGAALTSNNRWAAGYAYANDRFAASYSPLAPYAYNRAGGSIVITRPSGTIGRYLVRFNGLSAYLGAKSTVKVTGHASDGGKYCNPVRPKLIDDVVEVRCFSARGEPTSAKFSILVMKNYPDVAFAHAHMPTGNDYAPAGGSSSNPHGAIRVFRLGTGFYRVQFSGLGSALGSSGANVQVSQVGTGSHYCKVEDSFGSLNLAVNVRCRNAAGSPVNAKFNVFVATPFSNLGYAWVYWSVSPRYPVFSTQGWNAGGGWIQITRTRLGNYTVTFNGLSLLDGGNAQVTAYGTGTAKCKQIGWGTQYVNVLCYAPNGTLVDSQFMVLFGS